MNIRKECGTLGGILAHRRASEAPCGFCVRAEAVAAIEAEGLPSGLPAPPPRPSGSAPVARTYRPVTDHQAAEHRAALIRELDDLAGSGRLRLVAS